MTNPENAEAWVPDDDDVPPDVAALPPDVAAPPPDVAAPSSDVAAPPPEVAALPPDLAAPSPEFAAPPPNIAAPPPDVVAPPADVAEPQCDVAAPPRTIAAPSPGVATPPPDVAAPPPNVAAPPPDVDAPTPDLAAPSPDVAAPPADVAAPQCDVAAPPRTIAAPPPGVATPPPDVAAPPPNVAAPPPDVAAPPPDLAAPALTIVNESAEAHADPATVGSAQFVEDLDMCKRILYCKVYEVSLYRTWSDELTSLLHVTNSLQRMRICNCEDRDCKCIPPPLDRGQIDYIYDAVRAFQNEVQVFTSFLNLDENREPAARYIRPWLTACQADMRIRRLITVADTEMYAWRWDLVFLLMIEAIRSAINRNEINEWAEVEFNRWRMTRPVFVFGKVDSSPSDGLILSTLLLISHYFLHEGVNTVRASLHFHCDNLDKELYHLASLFQEANMDNRVQLWPDLLTCDDIQFCQILLLFLPSIDVITCTRLISLRLYRACLELLERRLADEWLVQRFMPTCDREVLHDLLERTLHGFQTGRRDYGAQIRLFSLRFRDGASGRAGGAAYTLPAPRSRPIRFGKPWWISRFRRGAPQPIPVQEGNPGTTVAFVDSVAITRAPSSSLLRQYSLFTRMNELSPQELDAANALERLVVNQEATRFYDSLQSGIQDSDLREVPFSQVEVEVVNPIQVRRKEGREELTRDTRLEAGRRYHCLSFTYTATRDEWSISRDLCQLVGRLQVGTQGACRDILYGDSSQPMQGENSFVFKVQRRPADHKMDTYLADVRTQSIARFYVERFRQVTGDRFGCLRMLHSDFIAVLDDDRKIIVDFMNREAHFKLNSGGPAKYIKFTNDTIWKNLHLDIDIFEAFSHFSYEDSEGVMMVADLQGWISSVAGSDQIYYMLTDPVLHCRTDVHMFGLCNRSQKGMAEFFSVIHPVCNHICHHIGLSRPECSEL